MTFQETGLKPEIIDAVTDLGFTQPTPIQEKAIPVILSQDHDLVALAQTGTGKTAAFGLPILHQIDLGSKGIQALMLAPTRELCVQISKDLESFSKYLKGLNIAAVYGGSSIDTQIRQLKKGVQIVVGTPGRTLDLIRRGVLKVEEIQWLVLDEADEMLKMGFQEDMDAILAATPPTRQTLLFSATMPQEIVGMTRRYMKNPEEIQIGAKNTGSVNVEHWFYVVNPRDRYLALKRIADMHPDIYGIIFCKTRIETQEIASQLISDNYNADSLHGDLSQSQRDHVMARFRSGHLQLLVATDVAARGLDVDDLSHVINYRLPDHLDSYIHRSGRTGRAGKKGVSISIVGPRDKRLIRSLEHQVGREFIMKRVPTGAEILQHQLLNYVNRIKAVEVDEKAIAPFMESIYPEVEELSREELIKKIASLEFNRLLEYYRAAGDLNAGLGREREERSRNREERGRAEWPERGERNERSDRGDRSERGERGDRGERRDRRDERGPKGFSRFFINLGLKNQLNPPKLIDIINNRPELRDVAIGKIEIFKKFSFFEVDSRFAAEAVTSLSGDNFDGVTMHVELAEAPKHAAGFGKEKDFGFGAKKRKKPADGFWTKAPSFGEGGRSGRGGKPGGGRKPGSKPSGGFGKSGPGKPRKGFA